MGHHGVSSYVCVHRFAWPASERIHFEELPRGLFVVQVGEMDAHESDNHFQTTDMSGTLTISYVHDGALCFMVKGDLTHEVSSSAGEDKLDSRSFLIVSKVSIDTP